MEICFNGINNSLKDVTLMKIGYIKRLICDLKMQFLYKAK